MASLNLLEFHASKIKVSEILNHLLRSYDINNFVIIFRLQPAQPSLAEQLPLIENGILEASKMLFKYKKGKVLI